MEVNAFTGNNQLFSKELKSSIKNAKEINIIVSFIMESGVKSIIEDLKQAIQNGTKIAILTGNYLNITQPQALYLLRSELGDKLDLRFYNVPNKSFHPKAYIFHNTTDSEIYIGSSNLSKGALTNSIEWNYHFKKSQNPNDFNHFHKTFQDLFNNHSTIIDDKVLREYSKTWKKPKFIPSKNIKENLEEKEPKNQTKETYEPKGAQIEALYSLKQSREEGFDKALVVAATGIGKTYLSAFDSKEYNKILFIAHREEIIKQAAKSFHNIYPNKSIGYFYSKEKETKADLTFALVETLGKKQYLNNKYFEKNHFDYIIIDEFHHAVANNYKQIINYFTPKFLLGLTATPERLDNKDVFALCDYNNVYEIRLKEAINKGFLVPFKYYGIYDNTVNYDKVKIKNGKYEKKSLEQTLMINKRAELVYKNYLKYNPKRTLGFCSSRNHAEYMAKYFNQNKIPSASVYSGEQGDHTEKRNTAIEKLKSNELKVLFTVDMFNEGIDIPEIDTILFLRPTQSPTIFLQQLGRGLRKANNKTHLTILDFIGNYKKASLAPLLLSEEETNQKTLINKSPLELEYPEDCHIDFDFQLVDLFKEQAKQELKVKDQIIIEYNIIKEKTKTTPSRVELFLQMEDNTLNLMKKNTKYNIFKDYIKFLNENNYSNQEEKNLNNTIAHKFLKTIENTSMTKSYKMPILKAFYNKGEIKLNITEEEVYKSMQEFYNYKSNGADMLKDKSSKNYKTWKKQQYLSLAYKNPIKYLKKTHKEFFIEKEGYAIALNPKLEPYIKQETFKKHFKDIIEYRTINYYKTRLEKKKV